MNGSIYIIKNKINRKVYVGQTIQGVTERISQHFKLLKSNKNQAISKAIKKYGKEEFYFEILEEGISSRKKLNEKEEYYIRKYNSIVPNGYNLSPGGQKWRNKPKLTKNQEEEVISKYKMGYSSRKIALEYKVSYKTILDTLDRNNVERRKRNCNLPDKTSKVTKEIMEDLYMDKRLLIKEIASLLNVDVWTINYAKRRYGMSRK